MTRVAAAREARRPGLVPALPRPAWMVLAGDFVSAIGSGLTLPFLFLYAHRVRDLPDGMAGLMVAMAAPRNLRPPAPAITRQRHHHGDRPGIPGDKPHRVPSPATA